MIYFKQTAHKRLPFSIGYMEQAGDVHYLLKNENGYVYSYELNDTVKTWLDDNDYVHLIDWQFISGHDDRYGNIFELRFSTWNRATSFAIVWDQSSHMIRFLAEDQRRRDDMMEMTQWLKDNIQIGTYAIGSSTVYLTDVNEAVLFKLQWGV